MYRLTIAVLFAGSLLACKGEDKKPAGSAAPASTASGTPSGAAAPTPPPAKAAVDVCSFATKEQIEGAIGKLSGEPKASTPQGSLLGGCEYETEDMTSVLAHARPAGEYDGTVDASGALGDVAGLGEKTTNTRAGLLIKVAGKSYFLHVFAAGAKGMDADKALAAAKVIVAGAK